MRALLRDVYFKENILFHLNYTPMSTILLIIALLIIVTVMLQAKGSGLSIIPSSNDFGKFERRGPEKIIHQATIGLIVAFVALSILSYFVA